MVVHGMHRFAAVGAFVVTSVLGLGVGLGSNLLWPAAANAGRGETQLQAVSADPWWWPIPGLHRRGMRGAKIRAGEHSVVVRLPGVRSRPITRHLDEGPVRLLRLRRYRRGTVVTLIPRGSAAALAAALEVRLKPRAGLWVGRAASPGALADGAAAQGTDSTFVAARGGRSLAASTSGSAFATARGTPANVVSASPGSSGGASQDATLGALRRLLGNARNDSARAMDGGLNALVGGKEGASGGAGPAFPSLATDPSVRRTAMIGGVLLLLAALAWWLKRARRSWAEAKTSGIEVVATQGMFGSKHRLALVETCGERFLVSSSNDGVRLLTHLTGDEIDAVAAEAASAGAGGHGVHAGASGAAGASADDQSVLQASMQARGFSRILSRLRGDERAVAEPAPTSSAPAEPGHSDLAGIVRLKKKQSSEAKDGAAA